MTKKCLLTNWHVFHKSYSKINISNSNELSKCKYLKCLKSFFFMSRIYLIWMLLIKSDTLISLKLLWKAPLWLLFCPWMNQILNRISFVAWIQLLKNTIPKHLWWILSMCEMLAQNQIVSFFYSHVILLCLSA